MMEGSQCPRDTTTRHRFQLKHQLRRAQLLSKVSQPSPVILLVHAVGVENRVRHLCELERLGLRAAEPRDNPWRQRK